MLNKSKSQQKLKIKQKSTQLERGNKERKFTNAQRKKKKKIIRNKKAI